MGARELDGWIVALLVGRERDGWMVVLLVGKRAGRLDGGAAGKERESGTAGWWRCW